MNELKSKIDYYLENEPERREIAEAGRRRAQKEHTYRHRLETLLETVFGDGQGFPRPELPGF
jgi:spore maturation protein CgeB